MHTQCLNQIMFQSLKHHGYHDNIIIKYDFYYCQAYLVIQVKTIVGVPSIQKRTSILTIHVHLHVVHLVIFCGFKTIKRHYQAIFLLSYYRFTASKTSNRCFLLSCHAGWSISCSDTLCSCCLLSAITC